ncbi:MAG TPA: hypothetical protein VEK06_00110 [Myxococcota bacterium]|nr:hypothetical protein [Myxococcota bacterium]
MLKQLLVSTAFLLVMSSCTSVTKQSSKTTILGASQEDTLGGTGTSSADIRTMAERMARDIAAIEWENYKVVRIALTHIENETRFPINANVIKDRLLADLVEFSQASAPKTAPAQGEVAPGPAKIQFTESVGANVDFRLSGRITALSKGSSEGVSDYLLYSFKLVDKANTVVWMKTYETKKQGNVGVMYR